MNDLTRDISPDTEQRYYRHIVSLAMALLLLLGASVMLGSHALSTQAIWQTLFGTAPSQTAETVVWTLRLPRALVAMMAGAVFALSGAILQNVTRNPLADPSLVGVSQGASFAIVTVIVLLPELSAFYRPVIAFVGAIGAAGLIQTIALRKSESSSMRFILTGIGVAAFISAMIAAMLTYGRIEQAQAALGWLSGSVYNASWSEVYLLGFALLMLLPIVWVMSREMAVLRMGDEIAIGLGIMANRCKTILITLSVLLAAFGVSAVGPLAFVGLIAPHLARRVFKSTVEQHLWLSGLLGALMVGLADLLGRTVVAPFQIPAGLVTVLVGVPCFLFLMLHQSTTR